MPKYNNYDELIKACNERGVSPKELLLEVQRDYKNARGFFTIFEREIVGGCTQGRFTKRLIELSGLTLDENGLYVDKDYN